MEVHYNRGSKCQMTIKEIAKLAGVSSAAVSRYLNGGYVSDEKKEQIKKVIEETGYQPSAHFYHYQQNTNICVLYFRKNRTHYSYQQP